MDGCKFKIGDIVAVVGSCTNTERGFMDGDQQRWLVVGVRADECYGGRQNNYSCRGFQANGSVTKEYFSFNEIEIQLSEPFKPRPEKS